MIFRPLARTLAAALGTLALAATFTPAARAGYTVETLALPPEIRGGLFGVTFTPNGTLVIATRHGEIWMRAATPAANAPVGGWRLFARGLDEPAGIIAESERTVYVAHRPELLRAHDSDGDGKADTFDALGGKWGQSQNYHEFFYGLRRDKAGNFYGGVSLDSLAAPNAEAKALVAKLPIRGKRDYNEIIGAPGHRSGSDYRGWIVRITPEGKFEPMASGFRQPNGVGMSPDGDLFVTDNQGDYKPSTGLIHVTQGGFYGHVSSLKWETGYQPDALTLESLWKRMQTPAVVFPHGPMGVSPGEPVWDLSGGKFGPFAGQVFTGDYSRLVIRATLQKVAGAWQGACFPFLGRNENAPFNLGDRIIAGAVRTAFGPDGALYLAASAGWGAGADGLQRITWDGKIDPEIRDVKLTDRGFALSFTKPMSAATLAKAESYELTRFRYFYHVKYGSPWIDEEKIAVREVRPAADGLSAELIFAELKPGFVYELSVPTLRTTDNLGLANPLAYYTANRLLNGEIAPGGTTRLARSGEDSLAAKDETASLDKKADAALIGAGEKVYRLYCVACHQPDGRGLPGPGGAANFVDDKTRLGKADTQLLDLIAKGNESKGMPAFGSILNPGQRRAVLAYLRATFGEKKATP